jgi:hypothetical protein
LLEFSLILHTKWFENSFFGLQITSNKFTKFANVALVKDCYRSL